MVSPFPNLNLTDRINLGCSNSSTVWHWHTELIPQALPFISKLATQPRHIFNSRYADVRAAVSEASTTMMWHLIQLPSCLEISLWYSPSSLSLNGISHSYRIDSVLSESFERRIAQDCRWLNCRAGGPVLRLMLLYKRRLLIIEPDEAATSLGSLAIRAQTG
jgi:hypothetical protein